MVSASPERLVSVRGDLVETRPIAGTRPRLPGDDDAGRIRELVQLGKLKAHQVKCVVIDEADRLLVEESLPAIRDLLHVMPRDRQLVFVSATEQPESAEMSVMPRPERSSDSTDSVKSSPPSDTGREPFTTLSLNTRQPGSAFCRSSST